MTDHLLVAITLYGAGSSPIAESPVAMAAELAGIDPAAAADLGHATASVCEIVEHAAFDDPARAEIRVTVRQHAHDITIEIDDEGMPFNQSGIEAVDARVVRAALEGGTIAEFDHYSRGRLGNRSVLMVHLDPGRDVRDEPLEPVDPEPPRVDPSAAEALTVREAVAGDAEALARLTWRTYGYTYQHDDYYHPQQLADRLEADDVQGWVATAPNGDIVGHLAVALESADALVAEGGRGMVDPTYRGYGVMRGLGQPMVEWINARGLVGLYGHAVTAHTRTQGGEDQTINGVLLGYLPPVVAFKGMPDTEVHGRRQAVAMTYTALGEQPARTAWVPDVDAGIVAEIFERRGLVRDVHSVSPLDGAAHEPLDDNLEDDLDDDVDAVPHVDLVLRRDLGMARLVVDRSSDGLYNVIRDQLRSVLDAGIEVVYVDLPLSQPGTPEVAYSLSWLGFYFGGVVPYFAADGGDVIRYQRTGDVIVERDDIHLSSTFSTRVLDHVFERKHAAGTS